ncbi:MAG: hypothetical protein ABWY19_05580, partial [Marmoricola sp.]
RQEWRGTGAALTDASVTLLSQASDGLGLLFDPQDERGARLTWVRLPLTATDMSPTPWTWGWDGRVASLSPQARASASMVREIAELRSEVQVVATPWSAPVWMKEPRGIRGGALLDDQVDEYAAMLVAQTEALRASDVPLAALTLGNEPGFSTDYPSMTMTDEQQVELADRVAPGLSGEVELWAVDHNWADRTSYDAILRGAPRDFDAAAFHCYEGRPDQMRGLPVPPLVTECTGTTSSWAEAFRWDARNLVERSIAAGSTGLLMWNLAVDPRGGPRDETSSAGCADCRGLLRVDGDDVRPEPEFYVLAHLQRAAEPGARVLAVEATPGVSAAAFANPGGTIGVFAHNGTGADQVVAITVPGRQDLRYDVRAGELLSVQARG